ncbi:MAG: 50S ribosomal protein L21 [Herpetosiphonaceae bacterium]|nr:50S ribosomal protein L21 [Herpetosiphonaceae bacterium]
MYAVINDRGAQYRVEEGRELDVALLDATPGTEITFGDVLLVGGETVKIGNPTINGASVLAEVVGEAHGPKIVVFKYKSKARYRRRTGHRQDYTRLMIKQIVS